MGGGFRVLVPATPARYATLAPVTWPVFALA